MNTAATIATTIATRMTITLRRDLGGRMAAVNRSLLPVMEICSPGFAGSRWIWPKEIVSFSDDAISDEISRHRLLLNEIEGKILKIPNFWMRSWLISYRKPFSVDKESITTNVRMSWTKFYFCTNMPRHWKLGLLTFQLLDHGFSRTMVGQIHLGTQILKRWVVFHVFHECVYDVLSYWGFLVSNAWNWLVEDREAKRTAFLYFAWSRLQISFEQHDGAPFLIPCGKHFKGD